MKCCQSCTCTKEKVEEMTHDERLAYAQKMRSAGMGMVVSAIGCFIGLSAGLYGSIGGGAIGVGVGAASGLIFGSCGPFSQSQKILAWDKEIEEGAAV
mmetsp:Transcript_23547/g.67827  ORF Transcript_23547/g.67827 Transcript_23547/m.67827 type:complete len:98 (-) Transcript_23547:402-695(-)